MFLHSVTFDLCKKKRKEKQTFILKELFFFFFFKFYILRLVPILFSCSGGGHNTVFPISMVMSRY